MNKQAEKHLGRAEGFLARGDEFYGKAADAIIAAQEADSTLSQREIGERFGYSSRWVRALVTWHTTEASTRPPTPHARPKDMSVEGRNVKLGLKKMSSEELQKTFEDLPSDTQRKVRDAATEALLDESFPRRRESEKKRKAARNAKHTLRYLEADKELEKARGAVRHVLGLAREVEFNDEETDLLLHDVNDLRALLNLIEMALNGSPDVDWDAELAKISN